MYNEYKMDAAAVISHVTFAQFTGTSLPCHSEVAFVGMINNSGWGAGVSFLLVYDCAYLQLESLGCADGKKIITIRSI
jgi:hypothetical protein